MSRLSRFFGVTSREAMRQVRLALGPEALIISNRRVNGGVEIIAADPTAIQQRALKSSTESQRPSTLEKSAHGSQVHISSQIEHQMNQLRAQLNSQMDLLLWGDTQREHIPTFMAYQQLLMLGYSSHLARQLLAQLPKNYDNAKAWEWVQAQLRQRLPILSDIRDCFKPGSVTALVGPTGVGKTTTLAKLAYYCVQIYGPSKVAILSTDNYRIGAHEQLKIYADLLKVPIHVVENATDFRQSLLSYGSEHVVLVDSIGVSQKDSFIHEQANLLASAGRPVQRLLVLSATSSSETLDEVARAYKTDGGGALKGCIVTKLDEAYFYGGVVDVAIRYQMPVCFLTTGQRVPEDILVPDEQGGLQSKLLQKKPPQSTTTQYSATLADMAVLARKQSSDTQPFFSEKSVPNSSLQQTMLLQLVTQSKVNNIDQKKLLSCFKFLGQQFMWQCWFNWCVYHLYCQNPQEEQNNEQAFGIGNELDLDASELSITKGVQKMWAAKVRNLPTEAPGVFFFHDHLRVPRSWHPNAQLVVSIFWSEKMFWQGPLFVQQISANQSLSFPRFKNHLHKGKGKDPYLTATRVLPQQTAQRWHYHIFSAFTQQRFLQLLSKGLFVGCIVPGTTPCFDGQSMTTVRAKMKLASEQPLFLDERVKVFLHKIFANVAIEINFSQSQVLVGPRLGKKKSVTLYRISAFNAANGKKLFQFYAFSTQPPKNQLQRVLQALIVFVMQRRLKRQIQYFFEHLKQQESTFTQLTLGKDKEKSIYQRKQLQMGTMGALCAWHILYDEQYLKVKSLIRQLWGASALQPKQLAGHLVRLVYLQKALYPQTLSRN